MFDHRTLLNEMNSNCVQKILSLGMKKYIYIYMFKVNFEKKKFFLILKLTANQRTWLKVLRIFDDAAR